MLAGLLVFLHSSQTLNVECERQTGCFIFLPKRFFFFQLRAQREKITEGGRKFFFREDRGFHSCLAKDKNPRPGGLLTKPDLSQRDKTRRRRISSESSSSSSRIPSSPSQREKVDNIICVMEWRA
jgi:hypothetical protein